jgi:hypothetical protein
MTLLADRRPEEAEGVLRDVLEVVRRTDDAFTLTLQLCNHAIALAATGDTAGARRALREAVELELPQFDEGLRIEGLLLLAIAALRDGDAEQAIVLWSAGDQHDATVDYVVGPELKVYVEDFLEPLRARPDFAKHWQRGRELAVDTAVALGLEPSAG